MKCLFNDQRIQTLIEDNADLKLQIDDLRVRAENAERAHEEYKKKVTFMSRNAGVAIDFNVIEVFSVERSVRYGIPQTIVGYVANREDGIVLREWYLEINEIRHEELVREFEQWKEKRDQDQC